MRGENEEQEVGVRRGERKTEIGGEERRGVRRHDKSIKGKRKGHFGTS